MFCQVVERGFFLLRCRKPTEGAQEQVIDFVSIWARVLGQHVGTATGAREHALDFIGVQQVQGLRQIRFAHTFAFAGADSLRTAENIEEIRGK